MVANTIDKHGIKSVSTWTHKKIMLVGRMIITKIWTKKIYLLGVINHSSGNFD